MNQKQAKRIRQALRRAHISPDDTAYIGGHSDDETIYQRALKATCGRRVYQAAKHAARNS